jgi:hypothetical protein
MPPVGLVLLAVGAAIVVAAVYLTAQARPGDAGGTAPIACLIGFMAVNVVAAVIIVLRPPPWMVLVAFVEVTSACIVWVVAVWLRHERRGGEGGDGGSDFGHGPPPPSPPDPTGDGDEPSWWTEFEREFAAYAARRRSESVR